MFLIKILTWKDVTFLPECVFLRGETECVKENMCVK